MAADEGDDGRHLGRAALDRLVSLGDDVRGGVQLLQPQGWRRVGARVGDDPTGVPEGGEHVEQARVAVAVDHAEAAVRQGRQRGEQRGGRLARRRVRDRADNEGRGGWAERVTDRDEPLRSGQRPGHPSGRRRLRVEDDEGVEADARGQHRGDGIRAHRPDRGDGEQTRAGLLDQGAYRRGGGDGAGQGVDDGAVGAHGVLGDGGPDAHRSCAEVGPVEDAVCRETLVQLRTVVSGVGPVGGDQMRRERGPPDVLDLGGDPVAGDAACREVGRELAEAGGRDVVESADELGESAEPVGRGGELAGALTQLREGRLEQGAAGRGGREPLAEPGEVGDQLGEGLLGLRDVRRRPRPRAGADEPFPRVALGRGVAEVVGDLVGDRAGAQQGARLAAHPRAGGPAEVGAVVGGEDVLA